MMKVYTKAVLPVGFMANGVYSGIKRSKKLDLAIFYSQKPAKASCKFTTNKISAAPLVVCKKFLRANKLYQAVIVNSGNANCFTGSSGVLDAEATAKIAADELNIKKQNVLVSSTGIIGKRLPVPKIKKAIPELVAGLSAGGIDKAKNAILTTDTFAKEVTVKFNLGNRVISVCGVAKGAGMIAPNMATMLAFILTDANIAQKPLDRALGLCVGVSFNCITVDGCMSTNDSVILLANGQAKNTLIDKGKNFDAFVAALRIVCLELAKMIVRDAEGATKFIQIKVDKAKNFQEARKVALNIANSNLFKTAMYGENPNFGRIAASAGACGVDVKEKDLKIKVSPLNKKNIYVQVSVNRGNSSATVFTSDLTPAYVKINAEYN
jgi:glutamate N-acetyltransferase/amino-acid N-acetyltransferase